MATTATEANPSDFLFSFEMETGFSELRRIGHGAYMDEREHLLPGTPELNAKLFQTKAQAVRYWLAKHLSAVACDSPQTMNPVGNKAAETMQTLCQLADKHERRASDFRLAARVAGEFFKWNEHRHTEH